MNSLRSCQARSKLSNNVRDLSLLTTTVSVPAVLMCLTGLGGLQASLILN